MKSPLDPMLNIKNSYFKINPIHGIIQLSETNAIHENIVVKNFRLIFYAFKRQ